MDTRHPAPDTAKVLECGRDLLEWPTGVTPLLAPKPYCMQERDSVQNGGRGAGAWKSPQKDVPGKPNRNRAMCSNPYPDSLRIVGVPVCVAEYFDQNKERV